MTAVLRVEQGRQTTHRKARSKGRKNGNRRQGDGKKVRSTQAQCAGKAGDGKGEWKVNVCRGEPCVRPNRNEQEEKKGDGRKGDGRKGKVNA